MEHVVIGSIIGGIIGVTLAWIMIKVITKRSPK